MKKSLSVVTPTFNEKENIEILVPKILDVFDTYEIDGEVIIVDDRSTDGTVGLLKKIAANHPNVIPVFRLAPPSIARSWFDGFNLASKDVIVCIDADLCHDPGYFPQMLDRIGEFDIVIGSRYLNNPMGVMEDKHFLPILFSIMGQFLTRFVTGFKEYDSSHSFRMFKKEVFLSVKDQLRHEGNVFLIEFLYYAKKRGFKVTELPIQYGKRIHGTTKLKVWNEGARYLKFIFRIIVMRWFKS
jgi:dolichol-phosphate mannosyltransferase